MRNLWAVLGLSAVCVGGVALADEALTYLYDAQGRLTAVTRANPGGTGTFTRYVFDKADNRDLRGLQTVAARAAVNELRFGERLLPQQTLVSPDARFTLTFQPDGRLVLMFGSTQLWASNTGTGRSMQLLMQGDGNLVIYDPSMAAVWATGTAGNLNAKLVLQNDGNMVLYSATNVPLWSTGTCCH